MSTEWDDEDSNEAPAALRKAHEKQKKELAELREELARFQTKAKEAEIRDVLTAKKVSPKIAKFILADGVTDASGVEAWLEENAELFGVTTAPSGDGAQATGNNQGLVPPVDHNLSTLRAMAEAEQGAIPVEVAGDLLAKIQQANSIDELNAVLASGPVSTSRSL